MEDEDGGDIFTFYPRQVYLFPFSCQLDQPCFVPFLLLLEKGRRREEAAS